VRRADIEAIGEVAGEALAAGGKLVRDMHEGIAGRPFGRLGPAATRVRVVHDGISQAVYEGLGAGLKGAARRGAQIAARHADSEEPALASRPVASLVLGALNGIYGNHLVQRGNHLALKMEIRRHGIEVPARRETLTTAFPDASTGIVVFVHGLCETEVAWRLAPLAAAATDRRTYGDRLQDELRFTPVYVRYNTGLHVSENGRQLARLLEDVIASWPVGVEELVLVGHSMGGLVARSACHYGEKAGLRWTDAARRSAPTRSDGCSAIADAERVRPREREGQADTVRARERPRAGRPQPLSPAQPSGGLRAAAHVDHRRRRPAFTPPA
jgi:Alpha/beta hydrolase family